MDEFIEDGDSPFYCQHPTDLPRDEYDLYYESLFCELPAYDSMRDDEMTTTHKKKDQKILCFADLAKF